MRPNSCNFSFTSATTCMLWSAEFGPLLCIICRGVASYFITQEWVGGRKGGRVFPDSLYSGCCCSTCCGMGSDCCSYRTGSLQPQNTSCSTPQWQRFLWCHPLNPYLGLVPCSPTPGHTNDKCTPTLFQNKIWNIRATLYYLFLFLFQCSRNLYIQLWFSL